MAQKNWFKPKPYTHISPKLSFENQGFVKGYVSNANTIQKHSFYPLIHRTIVTKRYKKIGITEDGTVIKGHKKKLPNGKIESTAKYREIFYCNHLDAHIYSYYTHEILEPLYENELKKDKKLDNSVLAYRRIKSPNSSRCKSNIDFANETFNLIRYDERPLAVLALDISKFFDSLDHKLLKKAWCKLLSRIDLPKDHYNLYKSLINFSYVEINDLLKEFGYKHPNELIQDEVLSFVTTGSVFRDRIKERGYIKSNPFRMKSENSSHKVGIPQGTPISAFLANLYLLEFDKELIELTSKHNSAYRRYSDDILIVCPIEDYQEIESIIYSLVKKYLLLIQPEKTQRTFFHNGRLINNSKPLTYLGFQFDGKNILLKSSSLSKFYRNMKRLVKSKALKARKMKRKQSRKPLVDSTLHRKQIYKQYSFLGAAGDNKRRRNFISYANFASEIMGSPKIKRQLSKAWRILHREINWYERKYNLPSINPSCAYRLRGNYRILKQSMLAI